MEHPMTTPEGKVKSKVNAALDPLALLIWHFMPVQMGLGKPALDYILCVGGKFIAIETKEKGKSLTDRQVATKKQMEDAGGLIFVVDDEPSLAKAMGVINVLAHDWAKPGWIGRPAQAPNEGTTRGE
jgi:hypothetical protein